MQKLLWIINPHSGRGEIGNRMAACLDIFQKAGFEVTVHLTQHAQDATELIEKRAGEFDRIVCAGGDGTLNEVVAGLMRAAVRPPLGYLPTGTTNDFAASLNLPKDVQQAAAIAAGDCLLALDVGNFNDRFFNYIAAFGLFTEVSYATPQLSKNIFGRAAYFAEGIKSLANVRTFHMTVTESGIKMEGDFIYGMITNSASVGGFKITPEEVLPDDGLYEVLLIYPPEGPMGLQELLNDLLSHNLQSKRFLYFRTADLTIQSENAVPWTLDGEFGGAVDCAVIHNNKQAIEFAIAPKELQLIENGAE